MPAGAVAPELGAVVDIFATLIELAGGDARTAVGDDWPLDSHSLAGIFLGQAAASQREYLYSESLFGPAPSRAIRDDQYKLIRVQRRRGLSEEFYDLRADPYEQDDLMERLSVPQQAVYENLAALLNALRET